MYSKWQIIKRTLKTELNTDSIAEITMQLSVIACLVNTVWQSLSQKKGSFNETILENE